MQIQKDTEKHDNNVAFALRPVWEAHCVNNSDTARKGLKPLVIRNKDAKNINNNVASAPCVNNSEERKIANAHKVFTKGVQKEKPLVIRNDNYNNAEKYDNNATLVHCMQSQKDAEKHDNNVASAHCVNNSEGRKIANACKEFAEGIPMWKEHKGLKPLVIRNKDAKNINNNVASAHCVQIQNFDSLSRKIKNPCSVINNFKLLRRIFHYGISKKIFNRSIIVYALGFDKLQ